LACMGACLGMLRVMTVVRRFGACEAGKIYPACGCAGALEDLWAWGMGLRGARVGPGVRGAEMFVTTPSLTHQGSAITPDTVAVFGLAARCVPGSEMTKSPAVAVKVRLFNAKLVTRISLVPALTAMRLLSHE
jgi:hypothetical protein